MNQQQMQVVILLTTLDPIEILCNQKKRNKRIFLSSKRFKGVWTNKIVFYLNMKKLKKVLGGWLILRAKLVG